MSIYSKIESYINKYPTKVRVYLSSIVALILLINTQDIFGDDYIMILFIFVLAPIVIYLFTVLIFKKE